MNKKFLILLIGLLTVLSVVPISLATTNVVRLYEKDPTTWQRVGTGWGLLQNTRRDRYYFRGSFKPYTDYTLIYYGAGPNNDVWPHATCLTTMRSRGRGQMRDHFRSPMLNGFLNDGIPQKIWLVESSDVNCAKNVMTSWNPTNYLFEHNTI